MSKIVKLREVDGVIYASSRDVCRDFGKEHRNVTRDIEEVQSKIGSVLSASWFRPGTFYDSYNRSQPCIDMTRDGWSLVVMGFTGQEAMDWKVAYILKFNEMEGKLGAGAHTERLFGRDQPQGEVVQFLGPPAPQAELFSSPTPSLQHDHHVLAYRHHQDIQDRHIAVLAGSGGELNYGDDEDEQDTKARQIWGMGDYMDADAPMPITTRRDVWQEQHDGVFHAATLRWKDDAPFYLRIMRADANYSHNTKRVFIPTVPQAMLSFEFTITPREVIDSALERNGMNTPIVQATLNALFK